MSRPTMAIDELLAEIDRDPTAIFWGWPKVDGATAVQRMGRPEAARARQIGR